MAYLTEYPNRACFYKNTICCRKEEHRRVLGPYKNYILNRAYTFGTKVRFIFQKF